MYGQGKGVPWNAPTLNSKFNLAETLKIPSEFPGEIRQKLIALRRDLHRNPELSFKEEQTSIRLLNELKSLNVDSVEQVAGTGVIARIKGQDRKAPVVALRGDMDALPIQEETGLKFASTNPGVMHACGHDIHASWIVAAAYSLVQKPASGDVVLILQPAEEVGKGALAMIKAGALKGVKAIFGAHVDRRFPVRQVVTQEGPLAASSDEFHIELVGRGAHAARPHEALDPIVGASALVGALQTIISRRKNPAFPAIVTVGTINAGTAPNVIPDKAKLSGTIRTVDSATREFLIEEVRRITESQAASYGLTAHVRIEEGTPPIVNPAMPTAWARQAVVSVLGDAGLAKMETLNLAAEDFAFYMEKIPGCFLRIGAREKGGEVIPAHSGKFYAAEESIFVGGAVLAETARVASSSIMQR